VKAYFACALLIGFAAPICFGQFTPVIAKRRVVEEQLDADGNVLNRSETLGRYLRTSTTGTRDMTSTTPGARRLRVTICQINPRRTS